MHYTRQAVELTEGGEFEPLSLLALAYFETGDAGKAIEMQKRGLALLPPESYSRTDYEADLAKYRQAAKNESPK